MSDLLHRLRAHGWRMTAQRRVVAEVLDGDHVHLTADEVHARAAARLPEISRATVYNTLHQFTEAGLLREVVVESGRTYFDTNVSDHHHFYFEADGTLSDISGDGIEVHGLPEAPQGSAVSRVEVIVRITGSAIKT